MAEPLRKNQDYDSNDENPVVRARLGAIDGSGEGDGKPAGNLKSVPPEELDGAERSGLRGISGGGEGDGKPAGSLSAVGGKEQGLLGDSDQVGDGFKDKDSSGSFFSGKRFSIGKWTKKKTATLAVSAVIGVGGVFSASILNGPFEIVHVSQLMQKFHLQPREDETNSRVVVIGRYMYHLQKDGSGVQNTRMGRIGNIFGDRIEAKMNKSGLETAYTQKSGYRVGYTIDPDKLAGTDLEKYRTYDKNGKIDYDRTTKRIEAAIKREFKEFNVTTTVETDGRITIDSKDDKFFKSLKLQKYILKRSGYSGSVSGMNARIMAKRAGVSLHPIRKLDRKLALKTEDAYNRWKEERKQSRKTGSTDILNTSSANNDPDNPDAQNQGSEADEATSETSEASEGAGESTPEERASKLEKLQSSKGFKAGAGVGAIVGIVCMVKDINDGADDIKESQIILPAQRIAGEYLGAGSQVQDGNKDLDMKQVGFYQKQLHGVAYQDQKTGKKSSYSNAASDRAERGKTGGIPATGALASIGSGPPFPIVESGALASLASASCSTLGRAFTTAVGLLSGPLSFVVSTGVGAVMGPVVMNQIMDWVSGQALALFPVGGDLGNVLHYGGKLLGRSQGVSMAGRELSPTESAVRRQAIDEESRDEMRQKSFVARTFDLYDYRSLSSQVINSNQLSSGGVVALMTSPFKAIGDTVANFGKAGSGSAFAASGSYDYGFNDVGFSQDELDNAKVENFAVNGQDVIKRILPQHPEYIERAATCFGVTVDPSTGDITSVQAGNPEFKVASEDGCKDKSEDFLQFRIYILDTETLMSLACLEADDTKPEDAEGTKACQDLTGSQSQTSGNTGTNTGDLNIEKIDNPLNTPGGSIDPKGITLHWWSGRSNGNGINALVDALRTNPSCSGGCSVPLGITADGKVYQLTNKLTDLTHHAIGANSTTIGIEIEGMPEDFGREGIKKYPEKFEAVVKTVKYLMDKYDIPAEGQVNCGNVSGVHPHKAYNKCPGAIEKDDIDDYYFNEVMKRVKE